jgi:FkbM family methyltransferase
MSTWRRVTKEMRRFARRLGGPPPPPPVAETDRDRALERLARLDLGIRGVIDVGASNGIWSRAVEPHFPEARYLLIEANPHHRAALDAHCAARPGAAYALAAAGDVDGEIFFDARDPFAGLAMHERRSPADLRVPVTTVDTAVASHALPPPYFLKLDTHGFEVPILRGAARTLEATALLQVEVYNFVPAPGGLAFWDFCRHAHDLGFRPYDLCDPLWRRADGFLWQLDLFFLRSGRPEFSSSALP